MLPILLCITFNLENMIVSNLQNSGRIESLHPQFKPLFDYVKTHDLLHAELGRIDIDGDDLFIMNINPGCVPQDKQFILMCTSFWKERRELVGRLLKT